MPDSKVLAIFLVLVGWFTTTACSTRDLELSRSEVHVKVLPSDKHVVARTSIRNNSEKPMKVLRVVKSCSCEQLTVDGTPLRASSILSPGESALLMQLGRHTEDTIHKVQIETARAEVSLRVLVAVSYSVETWLDSPLPRLSVGETKDVNVQVRSPSYTTLRLTSTLPDGVSAPRRLRVPRGGSEIRVRLTGKREGQGAVKLEYSSDCGLSVRPLSLHWIVGSDLEVSPSIVALRRSEVESGWQGHFRVSRRGKHEQAGRKFSLEIVDLTGSFEVSMRQNQKQHGVVEAIVKLSVSEVSHLKAQSSLLFKDKDSGVSKRVLLFVGQ